MIFSDQETNTGILAGSKLVLLEGDISHSGETTRNDPRTYYTRNDPRTYNITRNDPRTYNHGNSSFSRAYNEFDEYKKKKQLLKGDIAHSGETTRNDPRTYNQITRNDPRFYNITRNDPRTYNYGNSSFSKAYNDFDEYRKGKKIREVLRGHFVDEGELLGADEFDSMPGEELLGFTKAVTNEGVYMLPYIIDGDKIQTVEDLKEYKSFLRGLFGEDHTRMLSGENFDSMNDEELLGFFKKLWKGIKKGVSSVGKFIGKVGKGVIKGAGAVVKGIGKVGKGVLKVAGNIGKGIIKGVGKVGKFVLDNAGGLLKAGLTFLPGGSIVTGLIDSLTASAGEGDQQSSESMRDENYSQQVTNENSYSPQVSEVMPEGSGEQEYYDINPNEVKTIYQDENGNFVDENGYMVDQNGNYIDENGEYIQGENIFQKLGKLTKSLADPRTQRSIANTFKTQADVQTFKKAKEDANKIMSDQEQREAELFYKGQAYSSGFFQTYGIYIAIGLVALVFLMNSNNQTK